MANVKLGDTTYSGVEAVATDTPEGGTVIFSPTVPGVEPAVDDIPKVFFGGPLQQTKTEAVVSFRYISSTQDVSGYAEIKAQGNSSMGYPKKNQTVKLYKDFNCSQKLKIDFKGWGEQSKFCFKANWIDLTHARNIVSARLWGDVVKSRATYANLPKLLQASPNQGAIDGFPVKVYAAGIYQGRFTINIPKDAWMANMDNDLDTHCILCGENYYSGCFRAAANINGNDWTDEIHDTVPEAIKTRWNEVISFVMNSTDDQFRANLGNYFDIPSLVDYHLFGLASCGFDAYGKNQIYLTYDGRKWIASMYDMDSTWGLYWNGSKFVDSAYGRTDYEDFASNDSGGDGNLLYIRLEKLFYEKLKARWEELKTGALSSTNIINKFERFTDIAPAELVAEDHASTTGGGAYSGIPSKTTNNIQQIRSFALERLAWTDKYVAYLPNGEASITLDKAELSFDKYGSETLVATVNPVGTKVIWTSSNEDVAVVNDGVVTALSNGSATITATCKEKTAICNVTVSGIEEALYYRLPAAKAFNGASDCVDTGVKLFDTQKDFTILMAADLAVDDGGGHEVLNCIYEESPWPGINLSYAANSGTYTVGGNTGNVSAWAYSIPVTASKIAIRFVGGVMDRVSWFSNGSITTGYKYSGAYSQHDKTLLLGCAQMVNGHRFRHWKGVIHEFSVHCAAMSDASINQYLISRVDVSDGLLTLDRTSLTFNGYGSTNLVAAGVIDGTPITWSSDNENVVTVDNNGTVVVQGPGSAVITVVCGEQTATCNVTVSGIETRAPYALKNGTCNKVQNDRHYAKVTVTNGNHVKLEVYYGSESNINLSDIFGSTTYTTKLFDIKAGDVVARRITNFTATGNVFTGKSFVVNMMTSSGELKFGGNIAFDTAGSTIEHTLTATQDYEVGQMILWHGRAGSGTDYTGVMEFDLELLVNGEKYI